MRKTILGIAAALFVPAVIAAQQPIPDDEHAAQIAKDKVAEHASPTAFAKVLEHRATRVRGSVVGLDHRPPWIATPPATRAVPQGGGAATRAVPPAVRPPPVPADPAMPPQSRRP